MPSRQSRPPRPRRSVMPSTTPPRSCESRCRPTHLLAPKFRCRQRADGSSKMPPNCSLGSATRSSSSTSTTAWRRCGTQPFAFGSGAEDDTASIPDTDQLEARTRAVARLGRLLPARSLRAALERERKIATSINRVFDAADVVLTPLCESPAPRIDACPTRGAMRSLRAANTSAWLVPWNVIGQPALAVPTGIDADNLPAAIHLAGRADDEPTLLALAAQIETARPFPRWSQPSPTDPTS